MDNKHQSQRKKKGKKTSKRHKQAAEPRFFSHFGSTANGLLTKGYSREQRLTISTSSFNGVSLTCNSVKHGGHLTSQINASYKYRDAIIVVNIDSKSSLSTTLNFNGVLFPSTSIKGSLKFPQYNSSKVNLQFQRVFRNAAVSISLGLHQSPVMMLSATVGTRSFAFGMEAKYKLASHSFSQYDAGISVTKQSCETSIILGEKGNLLRLAYVHHFGQSRKISAVAEVTRRLSKNKTTVAVGGSCMVDHLTTVNAKLNNQGKLHALLRHIIYPKSSLTISGEFDTKAINKMPRIGLALALTL